MSVMYEYLYVSIKHFRYGFYFISYILLNSIEKIYTQKKNKIKLKFQCSIEESLKRKELFFSWFHLFVEEECMRGIPFW